MTTQRIGKYACLELERRYLLRELPGDLQAAADYWQIIDRYVSRTRLRLRRMEKSPGGEIVFKLGQKYRGPAQHAGETTMTNLYLSAEEYDCLRALPASEIIKKRYRYNDAGLAYGIDRFEGTLAGLILAEIECETEQAYAQIQLPAFALQEVTGEPFFTGGNLAGLTQAEFETGLTGWLRE